VNNKSTWPKAITVDKRIVRILSSSTYSNFPSAIKEIIINGYDADAEIVNVDFDIKNSIISITDFGKGMDETDFTFYLRIAGKSRKKEENTTKGNRKIIGQFGVGFLSVLPFCEKYLIETTKKGSPEIVTATITSSEYFNDEYTSIDVDRIPINGGVKIDNSKINDSYTRIRLVGFSTLTKAFLNREYIVKSKRNTIKNLEPLELLKWELQEYLPISYDLNDSIGKELNELSSGYTQKNFKVFFNGKELYRNIHANEILDKSTELIEIGTIKFKYFISTSYKPLNPIESRYLLIRNLNVGVGDKTTFGIGMDGKVYARLAHLTGEILVEDGLNDLISVARDKFNYSSDYEKLKEYFRAKLRTLANELDTINLVESFVEQFQDDNKVSDLKNLKESTLTKNIEKLENSGFEVVNTKDITNDEDEKNDANNITRSQPPISVNKIERKIQINFEEQAYKSINVGSMKYKLKLDVWNYKDDFPAVKFEQNLVIVNENYPLFKDKNRVDTFLKLNILLLKNYSDNKIDKEAYSSLMTEILETFK
jgi:Histidine kinase-, DNA gyrase B-, and HSP90-like ATPase